MNPWNLIPIALALIAIGLAVYALWLTREKWEVMMTRRSGCCGHCDGEGGDASAPETGGLCWDCRGTGHPHLGPCGRWLWWRKHSLAVLQGFVAWVLLAGIAMIVAALHDQVWPAYAYVGTCGVWWFGWFTLEVLYDRRVRARAWDRA